MGTGTELDEAVAEFAMRYAAQNHTDYAAFEQAIRDGVLPAAETGY